MCVVLGALGPPACLSIACWLRLHLEGYPPADLKSDLAALATRSVSAGTIGFVFAIVLALSRWRTREQFWWCVVCIIATAVAFSGVDRPKVINEPIVAYRTEGWTALGAVVGALTYHVGYYCLEYSVARRARGRKRG